MTTKPTAKRISNGFNFFFVLFAVTMGRRRVVPQPDDIDDGDCISSTERMEDSRQDSRRRLVRDCLLVSSDVFTCDTYFFFLLFFFPFLFKKGNSTGTLWRENERNERRKKKCKTASEVNVCRLFIFFSIRFIARSFVAAVPASFLFCSALDVFKRETILKPNLLAYSHAESQCAPIKKRRHRRRRRWRRWRPSDVH